MLDYAENSCRLVRTFGGGDDKVMLLFETSAPGSLSILAIGRPLATSMSWVPGKFLPVQDEPFIGRPAKSVNRKEPAILWSSVPMLPDSVIARLQKAAGGVKIKKWIRPLPLDLSERAALLAVRHAFVTAATEMEIDGRRSRPVILETGSLGKPITMFDKCSRDSLRDWGVDPDLEDKIVRPVWSPDADQWFSSDDYPRSMRFKNKESEVSVRLLVDASGKVTKCTSLSHFDAPEFNKVVCDKFMARAKFAPAELADGTKVPSYYIRNIVFRMGY